MYWKRAVNLLPRDWSNEKIHQFILVDCPKVTLEDVIEVRESILAPTA